MVATAPEPLAVLAALGVSEVTTVQPVTGGRDTLLWRVSTPAGEYALRLFRVEQAVVAEREMVAMAAAAAGGVPVPAVRRSGRWQERPVLLLDWCAGQTLLAAIMAAPLAAWPLAVAFGRQQARLHAVALPAGLPAVPAAWLPRLAPAERRLSQRLPPAARPRLLHLDYHPLNVLVEGGRISAVIDWANAGGGDGRLDAARTRTLLLLGPAATALPGWLLRLSRWLLAAGWRRGYEAVAGPLGPLQPFDALAAAFMLADLAPSGQPRPGISPADLEAIRRWRPAE
jgi:aminoglycoside phosphotransferase (APT) family kinase protein